MSGGGGKDIREVVPGVGDLPNTAFCVPLSSNCELLLGLGLPSFLERTLPPPFSLPSPPFLPYLLLPLLLILEF